MKKHLVLLLVAMFASACATQKNDAFLDAMAQSPTSQLLTSTDWIIISGHSFNDNDVKTNLDNLLPANGARAVISFDNLSTIHIKGGCNTLSGSWSLNDNIIRVSSLSSTEMSCDTSLMDLDKAVQSLFSNKTITARIPNGIDNSLIRMQTQDDIYYVMQASNNINKNNKSYAGKYFSDNVFQKYQWKLISALDQSGNTLLNNSPIKVTTFNQEEQNLIVKSACGEVTFNIDLHENNLTIGHSLSGEEQCPKVSEVLSDQHFKIMGEMIGKNPEIKLIGTHGNIISLRGSKKK